MQYQQLSNAAFAKTGSKPSEHGSALEMETFLQLLEVDEHRLRTGAKTNQVNMQMLRSIQGSITCSRNSPADGYNNQ